MNYLAISTSANTPSAAVKTDAGKVITRENNNGLTHSQTIMELIDSTLKSANISINEINALCVDIGPGSFTGVRIGVSLVNAIAMVNSTPLYAVPSLSALCYAYKSNETVCALLDARNNNIYGAIMQNDVIIEAPFAKTIDSAISKLDPQCEALFVGDGAQTYSSLIKSRIPHALFAESGRQIHALDILDFTISKHVCTVTEALPLYLRPSQAERLFKEK